nr:unnamed protein product [Digitaria exilis]
MESIPRRVTKIKRLQRPQHPHIESSTNILIRRGRKQRTITPSALRSNEATHEAGEKKPCIPSRSALKKAPSPQSNENRDQNPPRNRSEPTPRYLGLPESSAETNKRQQSSRAWGAGGKVGVEKKALVTLRGAVTARREEGPSEWGGARRSRWCNAIGTGAGWAWLGSEPAIFRFHDEPSRRACCETGGRR